MRFLFSIIIGMSCNLLQFVQAQTTISRTKLSLEAAIDKALINNHDLKIQQQAILLADNRVTKANAGMLPTVDAVGLGSYTNNFANLDLRTFQPEPPMINVNESGVQTTTIQAGLEANYLLWDGGQRKVRYQLLEGLSAIEQAKQKVIINGVIDGIATLYFEIVKLQNQAALLRTNIAVVQERIAKIEDKKAFGKANKLDILQAQTNLNLDLSSLDNIKLVKTNLLLDLKNLMNDDSPEMYELEESSVQLNIPNPNIIKSTIETNNPQLKLVEQGIDLVEIELLLAQKSTKPIVATFADAGFFWQKNDVQQLAKLRTIGATVGISVRYNLFDGGVNDNKIQNTQISRDLERLKKEQLLDNLYNQAEKEVARMRLIQAQLEREKGNLVTYEENYQKVAERFKLGKLPEITLREAQLTLTNSKLVSANLSVDFEKSIVKLRQLTGDFIN